jgi:hypothetical protein
MIEQSRGQMTQSVTEYVIILALLAVAGIAIYGLFGNTERGRLVSTVEEELAQKSGINVIESHTTARDGGKEITNFPKDTKP